MRGYTAAAAVAAGLGLMALETLAQGETAQTESSSLQLIFNYAIRHL
jgi:hypothetical protein